MTKRPRPLLHRHLRQIAPAGVELANDRSPSGAICTLARYPGQTGVIIRATMPPMTKTQVYLQDEDLAALHEVAKRTSRPVAALIREAIRQVWLRSPTKGPVALWDGQPRATSTEHDSIYDQP